MSKERVLWNGVCFYLGEIDGKSYSIGIDGFGKGKLSLTLLQELERSASREGLQMKEVGSTMEVSRIPGSESYELTITPAED